MRTLLSKQSLFVCAAFLLLTGLLYYPKWKQPYSEATISWDVSGYYFYLPAFTIYGDAKKLGFSDSVLRKYRPTPDLQQAYLHPSGNYVMKYTMGQAILFAPFFAIGHAYAGLAGYATDGFSYPYQVSIGIGMLLYAIAGLIILRKALLYYFSDTAVAITLVTLVFASNYLDYAAIDGAMTHNTLFTLYCLLILVTTRFYQKPGWLKAAGIGLVCGMLTLTRPTEIISVIIPLLWPCQMAHRLHFFRKHVKLVLFAALCMLLPLSLQCVYWHWATGSWLVYSYRDEGFAWLHPQMVNGLFSYRAGWLLYTPVMLLVLPGFYFLLRKYTSIGICMMVFSVLFLYTCFSWKEWWYGAGAGQRAMVQAYAVFSFPLAALFDKAKMQRRIFWLILLFLVPCLLYNAWLIHQAHRGGLYKGGEMTRAYYWKVVGRLHVPAATAALLDNPEKYPGDTSQPVVRQELFTGTQQLDAGQFSQTWVLPLDRRWRWAQGIFLVSTPTKEWTTWKMPQAILKFYREQTLLKTAFVRVNRLLTDGQTGNIVVDAQVPPGTDQVTLSVWNPGSDHAVYLRGATIKLYQR